MITLNNPNSPPVTAVVLNLFATGLGIARSLGERGIPVVGFTAERGAYGGFSRYVKTIRCADSRYQPGLLLDQLQRLGEQLGHRAVIFPTRDHDLVFLDRFSRELAPYFVAVAPPRAALASSLNKWDTYLAAVAAGVPTPKSWVVTDAESLRKAATEVAFPCVLKPVAAYHWRTASNWALVGARKAISVESPDRLLAEYDVIAAAESRVLIQEQVPGDDDCLLIAACYIDRQFRFRAGFNVQKLIQTPAGFGTGCIVQIADRPELFERTVRLLQAIGFNGIAEVEYKWDARDREYKLIEINPRPWDQHRLGSACGVDLIYMAYCDAADRPMPSVRPNLAPRKWIAEDAFVLSALRLAWRREPGLSALFRQARGKKVYAIWLAGDPLPFLAYSSELVGYLVRGALAAIRHAARKAMASRTKAPASAAR